MGKANYTLGEYLLGAYSSSIGASPASAYVVVPYDGTLIETRITPYGAITTADATITVSVLPAGVAASAVTVGGTGTVALSGAAAGTASRAVHSGANRPVRAGDVIRATPSGASGANIAANFTFKIER